MCKILGLIPARAGSKRVPNKNIRLLKDKPLIAHTIDAALKCSFINRLIVTTDSEDIATIAQTYGAEVPFLRPSELAGSDSTEYEFIYHALTWLHENDNYIPDYVVLLYPTSPFRKSESIDKAIEIIISHPEADSLRSVRRCSEHPFKMWTLEDGYLVPFVHHPDGKIHTLSYHLLPTIFVQNASIYIMRTSTILQKKSTTGDVILPFVMDETESIDINNPMDFVLAEAMFASTNRELN